MTTPAEPDPQLPEGTDPPAEPGEPTFTKAQFDAALQRERDKLYGRLSKTDEHAKTMADELKELKASEARRAKEEEKRRKDVEAAARKAEEAELSAKELIERRNAEWEQQLRERDAAYQTQVGDLQRQMEEREALFQREREFQALREYAQQAVAANQDKIAPELLDFVGGNTQEEIDASVVRVIEKTEAILAGIRGAQTAQRAAMPGVSVGGYAPTGPIDQQGGTRQLSPEEIKALPMAEYAKLRGQLGVTGAANNKGLFG